MDRPGQAPGLIRVGEAIKAALSAVIAALVIGLGLSAGLSVAVSHWLAASLDAAEGGFSLVDTLSMFVASHLATVRASAHAAFLDIDVTFRAGLILLLIIPFAAVSLGTALFKWRFRSRTGLSPVIYVGLIALFYAAAVSIIALFTHCRTGEASLAGMILGGLFAIPGARSGPGRKRPAADGAAAESDGGAPLPVTSNRLSVLRDCVPLIVLSGKLLGVELLVMTAAAAAILAIQGSLVESLVVLPNIGVYTLAFAHGTTVSVVSNLARVATMTLSLVTGLRGAAGALATLSPYRALVALAPFGLLAWGGVLVESRRKVDRLVATAAFGAGYGALGAFLVWACGIHLVAGGTAVSLLANRDMASISLGAPWWMAVLTMFPLAVLISWLSASLAGWRASAVTGRGDGSPPGATGRRLLTRPAALGIAVVVGIVAIGVALAAPRVLAVLAGRPAGAVQTFSVPLPDLDQGTALAELNPGAYAVAGYAAADPAIPMIVAVDAAGAGLWAQTAELGSFPGANAPVDQAPSESQPDDGAPDQGPTFRWTVRLIAALPNGDIGVAGSRLGSERPTPERYSVQSTGSAAASEAAYVARLDERGRPLWVAVWNATGLSPSGPLALDALSGGEMRLTIRGGPSGQRHIAVVQASADGCLTLVATRETSAVAGLAPDAPSFAALTARGCVAAAAAPLPRGDTVVCGYIPAKMTGEEQRAFLALVGKDGQVKWLRSPAFAGLSSLAAVSSTSDGGFVVVGVRDADPWLMKTDSLGLVGQEDGWR